MHRHHPSISFAALAALASLAAASARAAPVPGPDRPLTDPRSVTSPTLPGAGPVAIGDLFDSHAARGAIWTRDGKWVVFSANISGRFNLWKVPAAGGAPVRLTTSDEVQTGLASSPDGRRIVFQSDRGGDEKYNLYSVSIDGGPVRRLTDNPVASDQGALISPDGRRIAYAHKLKTEPAPNLWVLDLTTGKARALTHEATANHRWAPVAWSADGARLIANRVDANNTEGAVWRITVATGQARALTPVRAGLRVSAADLSPDGRWLSLTSNERGGQDQAALYDIAGHAWRWLAPSPWSEAGGDFSPDGRTVAYEVNADGRAAIHLFDRVSGKSRPLSFPEGVDSPADHAFSPHGDRLLVAHQSATAPTDWWSVPRNGRTSLQLTHMASAGLQAAKLPTSSIVHYASADGTVISAILITPANLARDGHAPAVVVPHGGPTGQTLDSFSRLAVALASRGYVVIEPNPRGSTGYGQAFQDANIKDLGGGDLIDEVHAAKFLAATGYVDPARIGITGGSYGGFMTLMAIGKTPEVWAAAVEQYGIINWFAMLEHEDPLLQQYERGLIGDPVKDRAIYDATSPMTYIHAARAPLLVLQGENDIRVPIDQAQAVVATLKADGKTVDAHYYAREGHGFMKIENQIDAMERTVAWFDRYLKGEGR